MKKVFALFTTLALSFVLALGFKAQAEEYTYDESSAWWPGGKTMDASINTYGLSGWKVEFVDAVFTPESGVETTATMNYYVARGNVGNRPTFAPTWSSFGQLYTSGYSEDNLIPITAEASFYIMGISKDGLVEWAEVTHPSRTSAMYTWDAANSTVVESIYDAETNPRPTDLVIPEDGYVLAFEYLDRYGSGATNSGLLSFAVNPELHVGKTANVSIYEEKPAVIGGFPTNDAGENFVLYAAGSITEFDPMAIPNPDDLTDTFDVYAVDDTAENGELTDSIVVSGDTIDPTQTGDYEIVYTVTDAAGNETVEKLNVVIVEFEIFNKGTHDFYLSEGKEMWNQAVEEASNDVFKNFFLEKVTAFDKDEGDLTDRVEVDYSAVNFNEIGSYEVVYTVTNTDGEVKELTETITVTDDLKPVLHGLNDKSVLQGYKYFSLLDGVFAIDNDGSVANVTVTDDGGFDINVAGDYTVKVKAIDEAGNYVNGEFTVTVDPLPVVVVEEEPFNWGLTLSIVSLVGLVGVGALTFVKKPE